MKKLLFILLFAISTLGFSQNNHLLKTEDGRRVLLKADFTWEYVDAQIPKPTTQIKETQKSKETNNCNVSADFVEPKLNSKIQNQLKKGRATIGHIKKKVAKDNNCAIDKVLLLSASETKQSGKYSFCANGVFVKYKRTGNSIIKPKLFF